MPAARRPTSAGKDFLRIGSARVRHGALNPGQEWNRRRDPAFFGRVLDLLRYHGRHGRRPGAIEQRFRARQCVKRDVRTDNGRPQRRTVSCGFQRSFERRLQLNGAFALGFCHRENVAIEEALPRYRTSEADEALITRAI